MSQKQPQTQFRHAIIERMEALKMTPEALSEKCGGRPTAQHLHEYLTMRGALGEVKLDAVCQALGLRCLAPPTYLNVHAKTTVFISAYKTPSLNRHGYIRFEAPDEGMNYVFHQITAEQFREIARACDAAAGAIEKNLRPEANPSLEAIGEPDEVDDQPDDDDTIPF